jgi:histidine ammonia-lyase
MLSQNKVLSEMTNFDHYCTDNYQRDIFYNSAGFYNKTSQLMDNLYYIMTLEILSAL